MTRAKLNPTPLTKLKRTYKRGSFDREVVNQILDAATLCHVGYQVDGHPVVTPTLQWRVGDRVYWHGSSASRALRQSKDANVCLTATLMDGYVFARSAFNHSVNFRSAMVFGVATAVTDRDEKEQSLMDMVDRLIPERWETLRPISEKELKATAVLWMPITQASAKIRTGGPVDDAEDYALPIWAGTVPIQTLHSAPVPDENAPEKLAVPNHIEAFVKIGVD